MRLDNISNENTWIALAQAIDFLRVPAEYELTWEQKMSSNKAKYEKADGKAIGSHLPVTLVNLHMEL